MTINPPLNELLVSLSRVVACDLETTGVNGWEDTVDLISIKTGGKEFVLETSAYTKEQLKGLFIRLAGVKTVWHNAKFDVGFIYSNYGILLRNTHCTKMCAEMVENGLKYKLRARYHHPFSLVSILDRWLGITHANAESKKVWQKSFINKKLSKVYKSIPNIRLKQMAYAVEDVKYLEILYERQLEKIETLGLQTIYSLEHKLLPVLVKMEQVGCLIDKKGWEELIENDWIPEKREIVKKLDTEVERLLDGSDFKFTTSRTAVIATQFDLFGASDNKILVDENELNYSSSEQVIELFRHLKVPVPKDKEGKESTEEECLLVYLTEHPASKVSKLVELLLDYRKITKLLTTYGYKFLEKLDKNNHIHTEYTQTEVETGRNSSKNPNLQNIPRAPKDKPTKDIRRFFIARPGYKFITCDMNGAEVAIAADYSQEPLLLGALKDGVDMHSELASVSFSILFKQPVKISKSNTPFIIDGEEYVPEELRDIHKSVVFAKFYKGGAARVYGVLSKYINRHCPPKERMMAANLISEALDKRMPKLSEYLSSLISQAKKDGFLRTSIFGRIRYFDSDVYGEAANAPIQGTNAEAIKVSMINLDKILEPHDARLVMVIHDELVCEAPENIAKEDAKTVELEMGKALSYFLKTIKGGATAKVSSCWKK